MREGFSAAADGAGGPWHSRSACGDRRTRGGPMPDRGGERVDGSGRRQTGPAPVKPDRPPSTRQTGRTARRPSTRPSHWRNGRNGRGTGEIVAFQRRTRVISDAKRLTAPRQAEPPGGAPRHPPDHKDARRLITARPLYRADLGEVGPACGWIEAGVSTPPSAVHRREKYQQRKVILPIRFLFCRRLCGRLSNGKLGLTGYKNALQFYRIHCWVVRT